MEGFQNNYLTKRLNWIQIFHLVKWSLKFVNCKLLGEGKGVTTSTIKNFYQQKTNPRRKMIEAIQEWINKEKKKKVESEVDKEDNEDTNNIIYNNKNSSNSES